MKYFKDDKNSVYAYEDDVDEKYMKSELTEISDTEALALANPAPTQTELVAQTEQKKKALRLVADAEIEWRQYAVDKGIATDEEVSELDDWNMYRVKLMRIDSSKVPDIEWPTPPVA